jgi:uncharacterized protein YbbC (DUF1343 family)
MLRKLLFCLLLWPTLIGSTPHAAQAQAPVLTGIDVLATEDFAPLRGKHVGLITNQTGRTRDGRSTVDVLAAARGVRLVALFGPEHGVRGVAAAGRSVGSTRDARTGLPVYSLYGRTRRPTAAMLRGIDTLVFDIQDIGSRSYTFISTMGLAMETAAALGKNFVVLDRPNPLGGVQIEGNITEAKYRSFVSPYPIPYRHGLTVGELARMLNGRGWLPGHKACKLSVIPMRNYRRAMFWADTGLPWVRTSPNIPRADTPFYYAATGIVGELSALSLGIGTNRQFEVAGAPGLNAAALLRELGRHLPGFEFVAASWKPSSGLYHGRTCTGVRVIVADPTKAQLTRLNFALMDAVRHVAPQIHFFSGSRSKAHMFDLVCGTDDVRRLFLSGAPATTIWWAWNKNNSGFAALRQRYLLYS